jgi:S-adenosyl methyltransferase
VADFDASKPSIARVYDYVLGGKDNFAADRELADQFIAISPDSPPTARENRDLIAGAVRWAAEQGIGQFIDLGCGLPTEPGTRQSAYRGPNGDRLVKLYSAGAAPLCVHSEEDFASFFGDLELVPPGVADARTWRPGWETVPDPEPRDVWTRGAMARKTG